MRSTATRMRPRYSPWPRPRPGASQRGVALIEALVSILIFSFGVLGLIGLQANAINFSENAEDRIRASVFANEISSSMWLAGSVTVPAAQFTTWQTQIADPTHTGLPNGTVTITPTAATTNSADIVITWKPHTDTAATQTRQFTTRVILP
jgi:type IV pilus assembly protein PilV